MAARQRLSTLTQLAHKDFFGIQDITSKDIAAAFNNLVKLGPEDRTKKYDALLKTRHRLSNEVREKTTYYGAVRYDNENTVQRHGQYDEDNKAELYNTTDVKQMFVPDNGELSGPTESQADGSIVVSNSEQVVQIGNAPYKISEVHAIKELHEVLQIFKGPNEHAKQTLRYAHKPPLTFYFDGIPRKTSNENSKESVALIVDETHQGKEEASRESSSIEVRRPMLQYDALAGPEGLQVPLHELDPMSEEYMEREYELNKLERFDRQVDAKFDVSPEPVKPMRASEYLEKVRTKEIEPKDKKLKQHLETSEQPYAFIPEITTDSKGFNVYKYQVPDWHKIRRIDAMNYIKKCIVYHNYDILAINKPYGIASHEKMREQELFDVNSLLNEIAKTLRIDKVHLTHRLDRTTTGLLLFATSEKRAREMHLMFKKGEIKKTYWCITKGVPDPMKGVLDMPIGEFEVAGKRRSVPVPESLEEDKQLAKNYREARRAITEFEVLEKSKYMALVECRPQSGVKHQIRCHLGFGLKTPILGDHKYSHLNKLAPQILPDPVLKAFRIRQSKVRTLPVHLHAKSIVIPGAKANGETLFIQAELPQHFRDNLKTLRLVRRQSK